MAFAAIYTSVSTKLATVAPSIENPGKLSNDAGTANTEPPAYVWDPQSITLDDGTPHTGGNRNPKSYGTKAFLCDIACWGATLTDAERLYDALLTALRIQLVGKNYDVGRALFAEPSWSRVGFVLVVPVTFYSAAVVVEIPDVLAGNPIPETDVVNDVQETVTITSVTPHDNTGAIAGDGILQGGEG